MGAGAARIGTEGDQERDSETWQHLCRVGLMEHMYTCSQQRKKAGLRQESCARIVARPVRGSDVNAGAAESTASENIFGSGGRNGLVRSISVTRKQDFSR